MSFRPPGNPVKRQPARIRIFDGVSGPEDKVLRRTNDKGWELSATVANVVEDFHLGRKGTMRLRSGCRKINDTGKSTSIEAIFGISIVGVIAYAIIYNGTLEIIEMPQVLDERKSPIDLSPAKTFAAMANETITTWPGELL